MKSGLPVIADSDAQAAFGLQYVDKFCTETADGSGFCSVIKTFIIIIKMLLTFMH